MVSQPKLGNQPPVIVLRPKQSKLSIFAWPPRDLSDDGTCRTSNHALTRSSRSRAPVARAAYLTRRLDPRRRILPSCFLVDLCTMWAANDSSRHLRVPWPNLLAFFPEPFTCPSPRTVDRHGAPCTYTHNQGKHQHTTVVNHSSHWGDHHYSSITHPFEKD